MAGAGGATPANEDMEDVAKAIVGMRHDGYIATYSTTDAGGCGTLEVSANFGSDPDDAKVETTNRLARDALSVARLGIEEKLGWTPAREMPDSATYNVHGINVASVGGDWLGALHEKMRRMRYLIALLNGPGHDGPGTFVLKLNTGEILTFSLPRFFSGIPEVEHIVTPEKDAFRITEIELVDANPTARTVVAHGVRVAAPLAYSTPARPKRRNSTHRRAEPREGGNVAKRPCPA
jgi:hypothetical protein